MCGRCERLHARVQAKRLKLSLETYRAALGPREPHEDPDEVDELGDFTYEESGDGPWNEDEEYELCLKT